MANLGVFFKNGLPPRSVLGRLAQLCFKIQPPNEDTNIFCRMLIYGAASKDKTFGSEIPEIEEWTRMVYKSVFLVLFQGCI